MFLTLDHIRTIDYSLLCSSSYIARARDPPRNTSSRVSQLHHVTLSSRSSLDATTPKKLPSRTAPSSSLDFQPHESQTEDSRAQRCTCTHFAQNARHRPQTNPSSPSQNPSRPRPEATNREPLHRNHVHRLGYVCALPFHHSSKRKSRRGVANITPLYSMLGLRRLQRSRMRLARKPTPTMHGRPEACTTSTKHGQLPLEADAEACHQPGQEEVRRYPRDGATISHEGKEYYLEQRRHHQPAYATQVCTRGQRAGTAQGEESGSRTWIEAGGWAQTTQDMCIFTGVGKLQNVPPLLYKLPLKSIDSVANTGQTARCIYTMILCPRPNELRHEFCQRCHTESGICQASSYPILSQSQGGLRHAN
jgi:hypothetical protein